MLQINLFGSSVVLGSFCFWSFVMMIIIVMVFMIMLVFTRVMTFFVMLDVTVISDAFKVCLELTMTLTLRQRADLHVDVTSSHLRILVHMPHGKEVFLDAGSEGMPKLLMRHLATTELKLNTHFMTFGKEVFSVDDFDLVVVRIDTNAEF